VKPVRIQRRRAKGWRLPENTICVDRSTKWGNPFRVMPGRSREYAVHLFTHLLAGFLCVVDGPSPEQQEAYRAMIIRDKGELRGKNLACWCPIGSPCHAEVLLGLNHDQEQEAAE
jgi:hypothetical protein